MTNMLPGLPAFGSDRDQLVITDPPREVIELRVDDERVVHVIEPVTVPGGGGGAVSSVNGETGAVILDKADIGLSNVDNTSDAVKPLSTAMIAALDGKVSSTGLADIAFSGDAASLTGTVPTAALPALAISDTFPVASQAAMLALSAQRGDVAVRSDITATFILAAEPASTLANWVQLPTPADAVLSVNGQTGVVVLTKASVGLSDVDNTSDAAKPLSAATIAALTGKADTVHTHTVEQVTGLVDDLTALTLGLDDLGDEVDGKIPVALIDGKGDLLVGSAADTAIRLPVGADGRVLTADSSQTGGVGWTVPAAGGEQESYGPNGSGFDEWTCDPVICSTHYPTASGTLVLVRHRFRKAMSIDEIGFVLQQAGATPGAYSGVAVYADGTGSVARQGQSADQGAAFTTTGAKSLALTAGVAVTAGEYRWIGYLWQGVSPPRLHSPPGPVADAMMNVGRRRSVFLGGQTGFPATVDVSTMSANTTTYWFSFKDIP